MLSFKQWIMVAFMVSFASLFSAFGVGAADVASITPQQLEEKMESSAPPLVLDVREPFETEMGMIKGAVNVPLGQLEKRLAEVPKDRLVVVVCRSGNRSMRAATFLKQSGYTLIENLSGGMNAWQTKCSKSAKFC